MGDPKELKDKIILLENAVLNGSAEEVSALFRELDAAGFSARAFRAVLPLPETGKFSRLYEDTSQCGSVRS